MAGAGAGAGDPSAGGAGAGGTDAGSAGAGGTGAGGTGAGSAGAGAGDPGAGGAGVGGTGAGGAGAGGVGAVSPGAGGAGARDHRAGGASAWGAGAGSAGAGGTVQRRPFFVLPQPTSLPPRDSVLCQVLNSPLPAPSPSFESSAASALVAELVDFAAACRLDYATRLVAESESDCPPSIGGECALGTDDLEDRQEDFECLATAVPHLVAMLLTPEGDPDAPDIPTTRSYAEAITGPYSSQWQIAMDTKMASWKSTSTYVDAVPPSGANILDGIWIFRVKRPPVSPPVFKARYRDYELHSLDFSTAFLQGSLHEEIWLRRPPSFIGSFPAGTEWSLQRPLYGLRQAPREWQDTLRMTLAALGRSCRRDTLALTWVLQRFGLRYSLPQSTSLPTGHSLSGPPSDKSVEPSGPYPELVGCLMYLLTCTRADLAYPLSILARYVAPGKHRPEQ
ncbi:unnamed protein product [Closterium sp. NIES-53]